MHVLIIPSWYPENKNDIGGSFFREQALALNRAGIQVGVIYQKMVPIQKFNIKLLLSRENSFIVDENVPTFSSSKLAFLPKIPFGNSYIAEKEGMKLFKEYCNNYGMPDVIHVHSALYAGVIAQKIKLIYGVPYVITEHSSSFFRNQVNWWKKIIAHKVFDNSFFNIAVSKPYSNYLSEYFPTSKWIIVPNILNDIFSNSNEHCPKNNNLFTYLHISLLDENKNVSLILKAFSELNRTEKKIELIIGGHGSNLKKLKELASKLGIEDNVYFVGMLSREKIIEYYNKSDVFILSSNFESFGVVIIEALSQGLPVISTICGGPESLIDNENGILVSKDCVEEMVLAMKSMKKNYNQYDRVEIRNKTLNEYGENNITSILIKLYREVVKH